MRVVITCLAVIKLITIADETALASVLSILL